jgi:hypothetical protein
LSYGDKLGGEQNVLPGCASQHNYQPQRCMYDVVCCDNSQRRHHHQNCDYPETDVLSDHN